MASNYPHFDGTPGSHTGVAHTGMLQGVMSADRKTARLSDGSYQPNAFILPTSPDDDRSSGGSHGDLLRGLQGLRIEAATPSSDGRHSVLSVESILSVRSPQLEHTNSAEQRAAPEKAPADFEKWLIPGVYWNSGRSDLPVTVHVEGQIAPLFEDTVFGRFAPQSPHRKLQFYMYLHSACFPSDPTRNFLYNLRGERLWCFRVESRDTPVISLVRTTSQSANAKRLVLKGPLVLTLSKDREFIEQGPPGPDFKKIPLQAIVAEAMSLAFSMRGGQELKDANHRVGILCTISFLLGHGLFPSITITPEAFVFKLYTLIHQRDIYDVTDEYHLQEGSMWIKPFYTACQFLRHNVTFIKRNEQETAREMQKYAHYVKTTLPIHISALHKAFDEANRTGNWSTITPIDKEAGQKLGLQYNTETSPKFFSNTPTAEMQKYVSNHLNYRAVNGHPHTWTALNHGAHY